MTASLQGRGGESLSVMTMEKKAPHSESRGVSSGDYLPGCLRIAVFLLSCVCVHLAVSCLIEISHGCMPPT